MAAPVVQVGAFTVAITSHCHLCLTSKHLRVSMCTPMLFGSGSDRTNLAQLLTGD